MSVKGIVFEYQIGNSVNRKKWGFLNIDEYFDFFKIAQDLKKEYFPDITLLGGNIIDFDLPFLTRALFNLNLYFSINFQLNYMSIVVVPLKIQMDSILILK